MIYGLIAVIISIVTFCLWFLISFRKNTLILLLIIPVIFGSIIFGHSTYNKILGYPIEVTPTGKYRLVAFHAVPKTDIYLWILKKGETTPRAYRIDYSISKRKKLFGIKRKLIKGDVVIINWPNKENDGGMFVLYKLPKPEWLKK